MMFRSRFVIALLAVNVACGTAHGLPITLFVDEFNDETGVSPPTGWSDLGFGAPVSTSTESGGVNTLAVGDTAGVIASFGSTGFTTFNPQLDAVSLVFTVNSFNATSTTTNAGGFITTASPTDFIGACGNLGKGVVGFLYKSQTMINLSNGPLNQFRGVL